VRVRVDDEHPPAGGRCLRVDLNGGAASAFSPSIAVEPGVDYVLEGFVKTSALEHDAAWLSLAFLDSAQLKLSSVSSDQIGGTTSWKKVRIGPFSPPPEASTMIVGVHVAPRGESQDIQGAASFGSLWVGRLPRVVLTARSVEAASSASRAEEDADARKSFSPGSGDDASFSVFVRHGQAGVRPIEATCLVSGYSAPQYDVRLTLEDDAGRTLARHSERVSTARLQPDGADARAAVAAGGNLAHVSWRIPAEAIGFYRVRAWVVPLSTARVQGEAKAPRGYPVPFLLKQKSGQSPASSFPRSNTPQCSKRPNTSWNAVGDWTPCRSMGKEWSNPRRWKRCWRVPPTPTWSA
jgi:hypothetical protein